MKAKGILYSVAMLLALAFVIWHPYYVRSQMERVRVPVTIYTGDTLYSICWKLIDEYGDPRDIDEVVWYAAKQNGLEYTGLQPGQKIYVEVLVNPEMAKKEPPVR